MGEMRARERKKRGETDKGVVEIRVACGLFTERDDTRVG